MKFNNRGMTMVEIIVSIALISIVLIFLMNLFVNVRGLYNRSKIQSDYELLSSNVIKAVGDDIENYSLVNVEYETIGEKDAIVLTFDEFRPSRLSERIKKVLRIYFRNNKYYISYSYEDTYTPHITSNERITSVIREIPEDVVIDNDNYIEIDQLNDIAKIEIPMSNATGTIYDINIYGILSDYPECQKTDYNLCYTIENKEDDSLE